MSLSIDIQRRFGIKSSQMLQTCTLINRQQMLVLEQGHWEGKIVKESWWVQTSKYKEDLVNQARYYKHAPL